MDKHYKLNQAINFPQLRIIGPDEKQIGVLSRDEALSKAAELKMDLVLITDKAKPPIARIIDFNKFKYQQTRKERLGKKKDKSGDQKEIRFTPFIAQGDFETRIERTKDLLKAGHKVKLTVKFTGRQITRKDFGDAILNKACQALIGDGTQESQPKMQGKLLWVIISPKR